MFPIIHTPRLLLRQVEQKDASVVLAGYSDPAVYKHMSVSYHSLSEVQEQLDWYHEIYTKQEGIWWGICMRQNDLMIGNGGFHRWQKKHGCIELGYWILPQHQRQGYAVEAIRAMCDYAFAQLQVHRIEAIVEDDNEASMQLLEKNGFLNEGCRKECEWKNNRYIDLYSLALINPAHNTGGKTVE